MIRRDQEELYPKARGVMGAYHQMGHDSWSLLQIPELAAFRGLLLSPVNCTPAQTQERLWQVGNRAQLEVVLDSQFYWSIGDRGQLPSWGYFDVGMDTTDLGDRRWWRARGEALISAVSEVGADAVCSRSVVPRQYSNAYYRWAADCADELSAMAASRGIDTLLTAIVPINDFAQQNKATTLASILASSPRVTRVYLVFVDDVPQRQPRIDQQGLEVRSS